MLSVFRNCPQKYTIPGPVTFSPTAWPRTMPNPIPPEYFDLYTILFQNAITYSLYFDDLSSQRLYDVGHAEEANFTTWASNNPEAMAVDHYCTYLLLDGSKLVNRNFVHFVGSVFYVGYGLYDRPYIHLNEASMVHNPPQAFFTIEKPELAAKINDIWEQGAGVYIAKQECLKKFVAKDWEESIMRGFNQEYESSPVAPQLVNKYHSMEVPDCFEPLYKGLLTQVNTLPPNQQRDAKIDGIAQMEYGYSSLGARRLIRMYSNFLHENQ